MDDKKTTAADSNNVDNTDSFKEKIKTDLTEMKDELVKNLPTFRVDPSKEIKNFTPKKVPKKFLNTKRIIFFSAMAVLAMALIIVTMVKITNINVQTILATIHEISLHTDSIIAGWVLLLISGSVVRLIWQIETVRLRFKKYLIRIRFKEWLNFSIVTIFINTVTIFALGSDPYKLWWMVKKGLKLPEANAVLLSTGWIIQLTQMIVSYPALGYLIYLYFYNPAHFTHTLQTNSAMILVTVGYINDVFVFIALTILGFSHRLQYAIAVVFNWVRKILGLSYKSKSVLKKEFVEKAKFQKLFVEQIKMMEANLYTVLWTVGSLLIYYFSMFFAWQLLTPYYQLEQVQTLSHSLWYLFSFANVATVANNFIPVPGGEGSLQFVIISFTESAFNNLNLTSTIVPHGNALKTTIKETVFVWRAFNYYLLIIFGGFYMIGLGFVKLNKYRVQKRINEQLQKQTWFEKSIKVK